MAVKLNSDEKAELAKLIDTAVTGNTRKKYERHIRAFKEFCAERGMGRVGPEAVTGANMLGWLAQMSKERQGVATAKIRLCALTGWHRDSLGRESGAVTTNGKYAPNLSSALKGFEKIHGKPTQAMKAFTTSHLKKASVWLQAQKTDRINNAMWLSVMSTATFNLLRSSEYSCRKVASFQPEEETGAKHCTVTDQEMKIWLNGSKTDQARKGAELLAFPQADKDICPIACHQRYRNLMGGRFKEDGALFQLEDGSHVTRGRIDAKLRQVLRAIGVNPAGYASHSFRIGGRTSLLESGVVDSVVDVIGRWGSNTVNRTYARTTRKLLREAQEKMTQQASRPEPG